MQTRVLSVNVSQDTDQDVIISRLEQTTQPDWTEASRNLVLLIASLSFCGHSELKPSSSATPSIFQMENFQMPEPENNGERLLIAISG